MKLINDDFKKEINLHIDKIRTALQYYNLEAVLIGANANVYYSTGRFFRGYIYVTQKNETLWFVIKPQVYEKEENVIEIRKPEEIPSILTDKNLSSPKSIGLEINDLVYSDILRLKALFPDAEIGNGSAVLKQARMTKTQWEINEMKIDGHKQAKVYGEVKESYRPGMSDLQLQIEIEKNLRLEGALGVSRVAGNLMEINLGSVISGDNADNPGPYEFTMGGEGVNPALPVGANDSKIREGHAVMIDMNGAFNGYQTDMTRVWARGKLPELALKAHQCSIDILRSLEKMALPGIPVKALYEEAMRIVDTAGLKEFFMGHRSQVGFIGHGVGIQLNELPVVTARSKDILEKNVTIALEPKFVIPHVGAVGVENTYVVKEEGLENLTVFPEEIQYF